jgi:predicted lactoylglutathione lyase
VIGYVTIGVNDFEKGKAFYSKVLAALDPKPGLDNDHMYGFRTKAGAMLAVCKPHNGQKATGGNGTMVALSAPNKEAVDQVYKDALANGATDEGAPGDRGGGFYGAYFRDPDGNKLCAFTMLKG